MPNSAPSASRPTSGASARRARRQEGHRARTRPLPPEKHDEFRGIVSDLDGYVHVREGRAYWQLVICGAMRGMLLRVGDALVHAGRLERAEDVLFLTPEDVE